MGALRFGLCSKKGGGNASPRTDPAPIDRTTPAKSTSTKAPTGSKAGYTTQPMGDA